MFEYIDLFMFDLDEKKNRRRIILTGVWMPRTWTCVHIRVCVSVCKRICVRMRVSLCHNLSFLSCLRCWSQTRWEHLRFLSSPQRLCLSRSLLYFHGTDRQTTKDCDGVTKILILISRLCCHLVCSI